MTTLRLTIAVGALTVLLAAAAAGAALPWWLQLGLPALAVVTAVRPDSVAGVVLLAGSAYAWTWTPDPLSPLVLVAAAGMLLAHVAALVASQGPAAAEVDPAQVVLWARRATMVWLAAPVVLVLVVLLQDAPVDRRAFALAVLLLALVSVATAERIRSDPGN